MNMKLKKCFLVGGAPLAGKTTYAQLLAAQHQAVNLSTDNIRSLMQELVDPKVSQDLFYASDMSAEDFYRKYDTAQKVVDGEVAEGRVVEKGVEALLKSSFPWERVVIEGIAISPDFIKRLPAIFPDVEFESVILFDDNKDRIEERIRGRGLWGPKDSYPDYIKPLEVEWVILYNEHFKKQASEHGIKLTHLDELLNQ